MQQAKDNSRHLSNMGVNTAKTFEQNSRQLTSAAKDAAAANSNVSVSPLPLHSSYRLQHNNNNKKAITKKSEPQKGSANFLFPLQQFSRLV